MVNLLQWSIGKGCCLFYKLLIVDVPMQEGGFERIYRIESSVDFFHLIQSPVDNRLDRHFLLR